MSSSSIAFLSFHFGAEIIFSHHKSSYFFKQSFSSANSKASNFSSSNLTSSTFPFSAVTATGS